MAATVQQILRPKATRTRAVTPAYHRTAGLQLMAERNIQRRAGHGRRAPRQDLHRARLRPQGRAPRASPRKDTGSAIDDRERPHRFALHTIDDCMGIMTRTTIRHLPVVDLAEARQPHQHRRRGGQVGDGAAAGLSTRLAGYISAA